MEEVLIQVSNYGFPIVVSFYLLMRFEKKMDKLTESIILLSAKLDKMEQGRSKEE
ncbi:YvrJ family protein [Filifactor villosus]|uniref:YvrJ family protein n=1 Tax=Filifactor villosus TaxID=29374 RepID=A0ABV9QKR0_9FIRM